MVERYHQEIKGIALRNDFTLEQSVSILNDLPFTKMPKFVNSRVITPALLFFKNDTDLIKAVGLYLQKESEKRHLRSTQLRNTNIITFSRNFQIGDLVKFQVLKTIHAGKIINKTGNKMYEVQQLGESSRKHHIHAYELEKLSISEDFLTKMLINE